MKLKTVLKMDLEEIKQSLTKLNQSCFFCQFWPKSATAQAGDCQWIHVLAAGELGLRETSQELQWRKH